MIKVSTYQTIKDVERVFYVRVNVYRLHRLLDRLKHPFLALKTRRVAHKLGYK